MCLFVVVFCLFFEGVVLFVFRFSCFFLSSVRFTLFKVFEI